MITVAECVDCRREFLMSIQPHGYIPVCADCEWEAEVFYKKEW